jgi:hypothetical protein
MVRQLMQINKMSFKDHRLEFLMKLVVTSAIQNKQSNSKS